MNNNPNKNKHRICSIVLIIAALLISGCAGTSNQKPKYHTGTEGLTIEFQNQQKDVIYETEELGILAFVQNKGAYDITADNPAILRVEYDEYRLISQGESLIPITNIGGKSDRTPVGEEIPVEVYFRANYLTNLRESADTKVSYNLCYPYVTDLTTVTCIDTKKSVRDESAAACKSETYNGASGQGAPIVITKVEPETQLQTDYVRPQFKIYVENIGRGYVTSSKSCVSGNQYNGNMLIGENVGVVNIEAWLSGDKLECQSSLGKTGELKLVDSNSFIRCYLPDNTAGFSRDQKNYLTPIIIRASYTYIALGEHEVQIKRDDTIENRPDDILDSPLQGKCNSFEVEVAGKCVSKCIYCAQNPSDSHICSSNTYFGFTFTSDFGCSCTLAQCNEKEKDGKCVKGYCPGNIYCCASNVCNTWQVQKNGQCIDKCDYCASNPTDTQNCKMNVQGYQCLRLASDELQYYNTGGDLKMAYGHCDESKAMYCVNGIPQDMTGQAYDSSNSEDGSGDDSLCAFCAGNGACTFNDKDGNSHQITSDFSCSCYLEDESAFGPSGFVLESKYCNNGMYCCGTGGQ